MGLGKCTEKTSPLNRVYRLTTAFGIPIGLGKYTEETSPLSKVYRFAAVFGIPEDLANTSKKQKLLLNYRGYFALRALSALRRSWQAVEGCRKSRKTAISRSVA